MSEVVWFCEIPVQLVWKISSKLHFRCNVCWSSARICYRMCISTRITLHWRHDGCDSVSNHQPHNYLLNRSCGRISKKTSKLRVTGLCAGNSPVIGEFPAQRASNGKCFHSMTSSCSGTCIMTPRKPYKHTNFIICLALSLQNLVFYPCHKRPPVLRDHKI